MTPAEIDFLVNLGLLLFLLIGLPVISVAGAALYDDWTSSKQEKAREKCRDER